MSRYGQYGNYYDPVCSQSAQATGYTYQSSTPPTSHLPNSSQTSGYPSRYQYGGNLPNAPQHGSHAGQSGGSSANHAAAATSRLSNQTYAQSSTPNRSIPHGQYDNPAWYNSNAPASNTYGSSSSNRTSNNSWQVQSAQSQAANPPSRQGMPEQSITESNNTVASSYSYRTASATREDSYQTSHAHRPHQQNQRPSRYNSPLQAAQSQHYAHPGQSPRMSETNQASSQMTHATRWGEPEIGRQQSASVEPSPTTVDPSQVYDNRAELQRRAATEAEKRRVYEAEQAAKKAEEERIEAERRRVEEETQRVEQEAAEKEAAKQTEQARKAEQRRKAREEKKQSKNAASALQKLATDAPDMTAMAENQESEQEKEMRAMFSKMREFNAKNPTMLAKLWEEERKTHAQEQERVKSRATPASKSPPAPPATATPVQAPTSKAGSAKAGASTDKSLNVQGRDPAAPSSQPMWPAHKKGYLADRCLKWLKSHAQNASNPITAENIFIILDRNPSYVQLCQALEASDLKFDRGDLARVLLNAGTAASQTEAKKAKPTTSASPTNETAEALAVAGQKAASAVIGSGTVDYDLPQSLTATTSVLNNLERPVFSPSTTYNDNVQRATQSPYFAPPQPVGSGSRAGAQSQAPEVKQEDQIAHPPRPPADKEEAARKRTFGDLVDLTAGDSDEEPPPKRFASVPPQESKNTIVPSTAPPHNAPSFQHYAYQPPTPHGLPPPGTNLSFAPPPPAWGQQMHPGGLLSQHNMTPTAHVPQARPQPAKSKGPTLEQQQTARMKGKMLVEPVMRDRVARKSKYDSRTIARDVLLATGRHPDMRTLNGHLHVMQKLLGQHGGDSGGSGGEGGGGTDKGNRSDLSTIRWDIIDPVPPEIEPGDTDADHAGHEYVQEDGPQIASRRHEAQTVDYEVPLSGLTDAGKPRKKLGRPAKSAVSSSVRVSAGGAVIDKAGLGDTTPVPTSSRLATPSSAPQPTRANGNMATGTPVGYAAFRQIRDDGTVVKTKGRPVGWRKKLHSREAQGLAPKSSASLPSRSKQQQAGPKAASMPVEPQYQVYSCQWAGCKAQLHNLDTLKKHMIKIHDVKSSDQDQYHCLWQGCAGASSHGPKSFDTIEAWIGHVDSEHLSPLAWKLGDGPKADFSAMRYGQTPDSPVYLLDREGRSVTPIISPRFTPSTGAAVGTSTQNADPTLPAQQVKALGRGRPPKDGIPVSMRGIDERLKKLHEQKRIIGPAMDRMGCVLADDGRRKGFLDDEDFEDEVSGSEFDDLEGWLSL